MQKLLIKNDMFVWNFEGKIWLLCITYILLFLSTCCLINKPQKPIVNTSFFNKISKSRVSKHDYDKGMYVPVWFKPYTPGSVKRLISQLHANPSWASSSHDFTQEIKQHPI